MGSIIYSAPMELSHCFGFGNQTYPWFDNQGNKGFAPSELHIVKLRSSNTSVPSNDSSGSTQGSISYQPQSGDTSVTPSVSSGLLPNPINNKLRSIETSITLCVSSGSRRELSLSKPQSGDIFITPILCSKILHSEIINHYGK